MSKVRRSVSVVSKAGFCGVVLSFTAVGLSAVRSGNGLTLISSSSLSPESSLLVFCFGVFFVNFQILSGFQRLVVAFLWPIHVNNNLFVILANNFVIQL